MLVVENMLFAEAMVPGTAGAVTELQSGGIGVGSPADFALMPIALPGFLALLLPRRRPEANRFRRGLMFRPLAAINQPVGNVGPEEHEL